MRLAKEFRAGKNVHTQVTFEAFNILDDKTLRVEDRVDLSLGGTHRFGRQFQLGLRVGF